jgi:hypothetical protein
MGERVKRIFFCFWLLAPGFVSGQNIGLSFSYFVPRNGNFSTPVSPFSLRGVGVELNRWLALETGFTLYRMAGLGMRGLPFDSRDPLTGPNFTMMVPAELVFQLRGRKVEFSVKAGAFAFHGFGQRIDYGNMDRALMRYQNWQVGNSRFSFENRPGWGYHAGVEWIVYVSRQFGISIETNYLAGASRFPLTGEGTGVDAGGTLTTMPFSFPDARIDFTGLEFSVGVIMTNNARRRR